VGGNSRKISAVSSALFVSSFGRQFSVAGAVIEQYDDLTTDP